MSYKLIGIAGKAGAGKDTIAKLISDSGHVTGKYSSLIHPLAATLKQGLASMLCLPIEVMYDQALKEQPLEMYQGKTPRELLQLVGTEALRKFVSEDVWIIAAQRNIQLMIEDIKQGHGVDITHVIVPDVRFVNEAAWILGAGGTIIQVERPTYGGNVVGIKGHASEAGIDYLQLAENYPVDTNVIMVYNDGSVDDLQLKLSKVIQDLYPSNSILVGNNTARLS
jgi:hypothetical protein